MYTLTTFYVFLIVLWSKNRECSSYYYFITIISITYACWGFTLMFSRNFLSLYLVLWFFNTLNIYILIYGGKTKILLFCLLVGIHIFYLYSLHPLCKVLFLFFGEKYLLNQEFNFSLFIHPKKLKARCIRSDPPLSIFTFCPSRDQNLKYVQKTCFTSKRWLILVNLPPPTQYNVLYGYRKVKNREISSFLQPPLLIFFSHFQTIMCIIYWDWT